ncbi:hypothetical protein GGR09_000739 [Bartonella heixiaziensis]
MCLLQNHLNVNTGATLEVRKYNDDTDLYFQNTVIPNETRIIPFMSRVILRNEIGSKTGSF